MISSSVPQPPGSVTNASARASISSFRSRIVTTLMSSSASANASSRTFINSGITPMTLPPFSFTARATAPINPVFPPP